MTNRDVIDKFGQLELELAQERGDFVFFALFVLETLADRWDLMISAPWLDKDKRRAVPYLVDQIKSKLGVEYLIRLNRIVVIDPDNAELQDLARSIAVEHGKVEHGRVRIRDDELFGVRVRDARIITAKVPSAPATT
jgi:hypothetical protein